ncbi:MAG: SDR family oxidoreductase [Erysipelotrichaceae bacterium]|nr:SDR family oxidoreductase [Erysipelotrichaceae bacterium]
MKVLITGASSGIGKSLAMEFSKLNYDLILVARNKEKLTELKKELSPKGKVEIYPTDLTNQENCIKLHEKFPHIDILINNAGFGLFGNFSTTSLEEELQMIDLNIKALHTLMKLYLQDMIKKDQGKILNVASIAGFMSGPLMSTYYASKNYVVSLTTGVKEELRKQKSHVKLSILCPGPVSTNFNKRAGVEFCLKSINSDQVAKYTIKKLKKNKFYIIPGFKIRLLKAIVKMIPTNLLTKIVYHQQKRKKLV